MSTNIPLGTYVTDGVRTGPIYNGQLPNGLVANDNGVITSTSNNSHGPGILLSSQTTWNITPAAPVLPFTTGNNLVALTGIGAITGPTNLTLLGDNKVTFLNNGVVTFDWPRVVTVTISGDNAPAGTRVTIFGTDWYNNPLQHTYVVQAQRTYPHYDIPNHTVDIPAKAFYTVNRVFISAALNGNNARISLGCADAFGLPYRIDDSGYITSAAFDLSELGTIAPQTIIGPLGIFVPAVTTNPATAITGDVRGYYMPTFPANDVKKLVFTYYVEGADTWINQVANEQLLYKLRTGSQTPRGVPVNQLTPADLYGVQQFYTGSPS